MSRRATIIRELTGDYTTNAFVRPDIVQDGVQRTRHNRLRHTVAAIDRSLERLREQGELPCEDCGEPIVPKRILAVPDAERCARCQELHERERGRMLRVAYV